jgi:cytochrome c oxidase subunit II
MDNKLVNVVNSVDNTFLLIFGVSALLLVGIAAAMIYFVIRYSRKRHPEAAQFHGNFWAEVIWIVVPTLLALGMFWSGWHSYRALRDAPPDALEVAVAARMWSWDFQYQNGKRSPVLVVPVGRAVKLDITSLDVLHGFYAPAFRIKIDAVPGMTNHAWFRADKPGEYVIFCSVYCGLQHAKMLSSIRAVSQEEFDAFLAETGGGAQPGRALLDAKGCLGCHSLDGTASVGPSLKDVWGRTVVLVGPDKKEKRLKYDAKALTMMIMGPRAGVVKGFEPMMPAYADQLSQDELKRILDFLEHGDRAPAGGPEAGAKVAEAQGCLGCHSTDGTEIAGPSFKGLFGRPGMARDKAVVDRPYVEAVLRDPAARLGKASSMPAFPTLSPPELESLLQFLESIGDRPPATPDPAMPGMAGHDMPGHDAASHDTAGHGAAHGDRK